MRRLKSCGPLILLGGLLLVGLGGAGAQDDKAGGDPKSNDQRVHEIVTEVIKAGVAVHNGDRQRGIRPNPEGCYFLYRGSLLTLPPLLDQHPDLQKAIRTALARAEASLPSDRGFVLREALDQVRDRLGPGRTTAATKTLWDRLGGEENVKKVIDDFVLAAAQDKSVNFLRDGKFNDLDIARLKKLLVEQVSSVSGGPFKYSGRDMKTVHEGMGITDAEFNALAGHLQAALSKHGATRSDIATVMDVIGGMRKDIVEGKKVEPRKPMVSLWQRLGGEKNVRAVVDDFVAAAAGDPKVNFLRDNKYSPDLPKLKNHLVTFVSMATDGPLEYEGRSMRESHKGMGITDAEFNALAGHLKAALEKHKAQPADVDAVLKAVEGTRKDIVEGKKEEAKKEDEKP